MLRLSLILFFFSSTVLGIAQTHYFHKQWDKRYGGTDGEALLSTKKTNNHGVVLGGISYSNIGGDKIQPNWDTTRSTADFWVVKIDSVGGLEWERRYGGQGQDNLYKVLQTLDEGYIMGGASLSGISGNKTQPTRGNWDYWIVKSDSLGTQMWDKRFGGTLEDYLVDVQQTIDSGYILGGYSSSGISGDKTQEDWDVTHSHYDYWVVKVDSKGNKEWDKTFGGTNDDFFYSLSQTTDGGYILGGFSSSDSSGDKTQNNWANGYQTYWVVRIDSQGNKLWDKRYGGTHGEYFKELQQTYDNGFILSGSSYSGIGGDKTQANLGDLDYWLVKIDSIGNKQWDKNFGGLGEDKLYSVEQTIDTGYLIAGSSQSLIGGDKSENNLGQEQTWIVKLDYLGNKQWDKTVFTDSGAYFGFAIQTEDKCYLMGNYTKSSIGGYKSEFNSGSTDYWIMKFCMDTIRATGIHDRPQTTVHSGIQIQAWPNPFTSDLSIALKGEDIHEASFTITNAMGQLIYKREESNLAAGYTKVLDLRYLSNGVYFVEVGTKDGCSVRQVVKE